MQILCYHLKEGCQDFLYAKIHKKKNELIKFLSFEYLFQKVINPLLSIIKLARSLTFNFYSNLKKEP